MEFVVLAIGLFLVAVVLPLFLWARTAKLQRTVEELKQRLNLLEAPREAAVPAHEPPRVPDSPHPSHLSHPSHPSHLSHLSHPSHPPSAPARNTDLETLIAGRWLNRVGLLLVFLAVGYFIQWAIDNNWIGPTGQVASGILIGAAMLVFSQSLLRRGYTYFSEGITGLGAGVLYLALWAGCNYHHLFSQNIAFFAMVAVTAAVVAIAVGRDSQRIAVLALTGGFLTPWLASSGTDAQVALFTYLAVLNGGLLGVAWKKNWRWLEFPAFIFTLVYFWGWYDRFYYVTQPMAPTLAFATVFFIEFSALSVIRSRRAGVLLTEQALLVLLNGPLYLLAVLRLLEDSRPWAATFATLALAAAHLQILRVIPKSEADSQARITRLLFAGLALTFATLAIPIRLEGRWITMAFVVEGAVLMWTGFRARVWQLRAAAFLLFTIVAARLVSNMPPAGQFLLNERFATFLVTAACFGAALYAARRYAGEVSERESPYYLGLAVATNVIALWALSAEAYDYFTPRFGSDLAVSPMTRVLARQLALSLVWTVYASMLMFLGVRRSEAGLRWQALVLFGITVVKVFFYDMSFLSGGYRVASSVVLGLVLLAVSFLYQRQLVTRKVETSQ